VTARAVLADRDSPVQVANLGTAAGRQGVRVGGEVGRFRGLRDRQSQTFFEVGKRVGIPPLAVVLLTQVVIIEGIGRVVGDRRQQHPSVARLFVFPVPDLFEVA